MSAIHRPYRHLTTGDLASRLIEQRRKSSDATRPLFDMEFAQRRIAELEAEAEYRAAEYGDCR